MKRLVLLVAALGFVAQANAQDADIKNSGEFRLRYQNLMDPGGQDNTSDNMAGFTHRFKWNITARKGENLQAMLGLVHGARWGYNGTDGTAATAEPGTADVQNSILVNRAWGWWKSSDALSFKFGRMGIEIADGAVFSENDWEAIPTSHEGLMAMWDMDFAKIALFGIKNIEIDDTAGAVATDPERNIYGVSLDLKNMPEAIKTANVHILQDNINGDATGAGSPSIGRQHFGLTVGGDVSNIMYKGTLAYQTGKAKTTPNTDISAMMYDLMVGYGLPEVMGLKLSAGYHMDTGDKAGTATKSEAYNPMFYDRHNYAGLMDVVEWGNLTYWNVNASIMPMETIEAGVGYYMFELSEVGTPTLGANYFGAVGANATDKELGSEVDLYVNKSYDNGFKIGARYSMFMVGKYGENATPKAAKDPSEVFVQASLSF